MRTLAVVVLCLAAVSLEVRGTFSPTLPAAGAGGAPDSFGTTGHRIVGRLYSEKTGASGSTLVVVLHGDAPGRKPVYQYTFASELNKATGVPVLALLRPGYADPFGGKSDGDRGFFATGDNYTLAAVSTLADAISEARLKAGIARVILIGHSGGAVLAANIAALHPELVQTAILVSCPCDVAAFRTHMAKQQWNPLWLIPVQALSPLQTLTRMSPDTSLLAISGGSDRIAPESYARDYITAAQRRHLPHTVFTSLPGEGHEILLNPKLLQLVKEEITREDSAY